MIEEYNPQYEQKKLTDSLAVMDKYIAVASVWKQFFTSNRIDFLLSSAVKICGFDLSNCYCHVELTFDGTELAFRDIITRLLRPERKATSYIFKRQSLYDKNAYITFPLSWFVDTELDENITFGLPLPMVFAMSSFTLKNVKEKWNGRWIRLYCNDGRIEQYRGEPGMVAEFREFDEDFTRQQMFAELLKKVEKRSGECWFTITRDDLVASAIKVWSETERVKPEPQILELETATAGG